MIVIQVGEQIHSAKQSVVIAVYCVLGYLS